MPETSEPMLPVQTQDSSEKFSIADYLRPQLNLEDVPSLRAAQSCSGLFLLFKELVRKQLGDFWIKLAMLLELASDGHKSRWSLQDILSQFHWLQETQCKRLLAQLSHSGWLEYQELHYQLSPFGRSILSVLTALASQEKSTDALGAQVSSLSLLEMYEYDPTNTLRMFLSELMRIDEEIAQTLETNSEYLIRRLNQRIRSQFEIAVRSREHLAGLSAEDFLAYCLKQRIHDRLSAFHARLSQVQRRQNDLVARKIVLADTSLTYHDINAFLIDSSLEKLAALGKRFISPPIAVNDLIPQLMIYEAEWQLEKVRPDLIRRSWSQPELASETTESVVGNSRLVQLVTELEYCLDKSPPVRLETFVPQDNWTNSAFRFSMISVLESGELPEGALESSKLPRIRVILPEDSQAAKTVLNDEISGIQEMTSGLIAKVETAHGT